MLKVSLGWFMLAILIVLALGGAAPVGAASCESLASFKLPDGKITSATLVAAGSFTPPGPALMGMPSASAVYKTLPAFCRVTASLSPTPDSDIRIEVWMPQENWNGKFVGVGNGVWAGSINYAALAENLARGYATAATDTGHVGSGMDARFAVGHPEKLIDFGHRAVHEMTVKAKAVIASFYGNAARRSLWVSCSTGGRQGLMEAYRYPEDYDGISAMAPANPMSSLMIGTLWTGYAALKEEGRRLDAPKLNAVRRAYIEACDADDGLKDGIVGAPDLCRFDPGVLQCRVSETADCLTEAQVAAMREIYSGPKNPRTGERIFAGYEPGSEQQLTALIGGKEPFPVATSYFRDIVFQNPQWDYKSFDYDKDLASAFRAAADILDVPSSGLGKFFAAGGKLLLSHGWSDGLIPADNTVDFYKSMTASLDAKTAAASVRLFMVPGMGHCGGGDAPHGIDMLGAIDRWVETGRAPDKLIATRPQGEKPLSRPVCPYPQVAVYKGSGSTDDADSFECRVK